MNINHGDGCHYGDGTFRCNRCGIRTDSRMGGYHLRPIYEGPLNFVRYLPTDEPELVEPVPPVRAIHCGPLVTSPCTCDYENAQLAVITCRRVSSANQVLKADLNMLRSVAQHAVTSYRGRWRNYPRLAKWRRAYDSLKGALEELRN